MTYYLVKLVCMYYFIKIVMDDGDLSTSISEDFDKLYRSIMSAGSNSGTKTKTKYVVTTPKEK